MTEDMNEHKSREQNAIIAADKYIGSYNPNDRDDVKRIKDAAKGLIESISLLETDDIRRKSIAITHVEEAAMMAIKSLYGGE